jgi:hypothetical protein
MIDYRFYAGVQNFGKTKKLTIIRNTIDKSEWLKIINDASLSGCFEILFRWQRSETFVDK